MARRLHLAGRVRPREVVIDSGSGLPLAPGESRRVIDEPLFRFLIDLEVSKAQRLQYCISVARLAPDLSPAGTAAMSVPHALAAMLRRIRATDTITRLTDGSFAVLLIDAETSALAVILGRLREELASAVQATWSAGAACYPKTAGSPAELLRLSGDLFARARHDGGDRIYIAT